MDIDSCRMATVASLLVPSNIVEDIVSVLIAVIKELRKDAAKYSGHCPTVPYHNASFYTPQALEN